MSVLDIILIIILCICCLALLTFIVVLLRTGVITFGFMNSLSLKEMWLSYKELIQNKGNSNSITPFGRAIIKGSIAILLFPFALLLSLINLIFVTIFLISLPIVLLIEVIFVNKKYHFISQYRQYRQLDEKICQLEKTEE